MNDTGQKILEKIKEEHIKLKPKWEFLLKNYVIWALFVVAIIIGSLAFGVMIFMVFHTDWQYSTGQIGLVRNLLISLPYFWFLILIIFLAIAFYNLKHTKKGYKYNPLLIVSSSILISIIIGSVVYALGGGEKLEDIFYRRVPFYQQIMKFRGRMLLNPERGVIPGVIVEVSQNNIKIRDFRGNIWSITTSTDQFTVGQRIILFGKKISGEKFESNIIRPWFLPHQLPINLCPTCLKPPLPRP